MKIIIEWKDEYLIGVKLIDEQHRHIFDITNNLYESVVDGKSNETLGKIFSELYFFIEDHFDSEELLMKHNISRFKEHIKEHNQFKKTICSLKHKYEQGDRLLIGLEMLSFLKEWLLQHVIHMDGNLKKYYNNIDSN